MPTVVHHQRLPQDNQISIERLFGEVRSRLPSPCRAEPATCPFPSKGLLPRLKNLRQARKLEADVHHIVGDVHYLAFSLPNDRTVLTIHDCAALNRLTGWKRVILRFFWFTGPMRRAAVVTTISETTKRELMRWVGSLAEKVVVIPNCVGSEFRVTPKAFDEQKPVCLQVGTKWNKNLERVAAGLRGTPWRLEIVGQMSVDQRSVLRESGIEFRELGRVSDAELVEAYQRCDLLIFASLYEGFGLPILEAQATGRPVITSNRSSMPEAAGDGALFVDPESVESIREAVEVILNEPTKREELVSKGFENVVKYRPEAIAARYAEVYEQVAERT